MISRILRAVAAVSLGGAALLLAGATASPAAQAAPMSDCTPTHGSVVAVDFSHWGGPIVRGCGIDPASGLALLSDGGFTSQGTVHDGPGFVCRIGSGSFDGGTQYPTHDADPCVNTPPTTAYWSYWTAKPGQNSWSYSTVGAMSDKPVDGEVELWRFGATSQDGSTGGPSISPAQLRASPPAASTSTPSAPRTTTSPARQPAARATTYAAAGAAANRPTHSLHRATHSATSSARTVSPRTSAKASTTRPGHPAASTTTSRWSSASAGASAGASSGSPSIVDAAGSPVAAPHRSSSPAPMVAGGALVVLLGGGAGWTAWRRRGSAG